MRIGTSRAAVRVFALLAPAACAAPGWNQDLELSWEPGWRLPISPEKPWRAHIDWTGRATVETVVWTGPGDRWQWTEVLAARLPEDRLRQLAEAVEASGVWQLRDKYDTHYGWQIGNTMYAAGGVAHPDAHAIAVGREERRHRVVVVALGHILDTAEREYSHPDLAAVESFRQLFDLVRDAIPVPESATAAVPDLLRIAVQTEAPDLACDAINGLIYSGTEDAIPTLEMLTRSEDSRIAWYATDALRWLSKQEP